MNAFATAMPAAVFLLFAGSPDDLWPRDRLMYAIPMR